MSRYLQLETSGHLPRLPLEGALDLTYRCNNSCRHCWIGLPLDSPGRCDELRFDEIKALVEEARKMGCRSWSISGGEPMLRPDFYELFDFITSRCLSYSLNTNGTLITAPIARLMKRKGLKMVALYGADAAVHDYITRSEGSFDALMQGIAHLREAGAGFTMQLVPMKDNFHQYDQMIELAQSLCPSWRIGAPWLYFSASGSCARNRLISGQRLQPEEVLRIDEPDPPCREPADEKKTDSFLGEGSAGGLFSRCILRRNSFHVDPYGKMSFCSLIADPALRYDLRKGGFEEGWESFLPSLASKFETSIECFEKCSSCPYEKECRWCPAYAYLEHRNYSKRIEYLCSLARASHDYKLEWQKDHRRYYRIAEITLEIESDLPITETTFNPKFKPFEVEGPGEDNIQISHHFRLPGLDERNLGREVYHKVPWAIFKKDESWTYIGISDEEDRKIHKVAVFNHDHTRGEIYSDGESDFCLGDFHALTLLPTDQILLGRILAQRSGCYVHSSGILMDGKGLLFVGHSGAGKSTIASLFKKHGRILCDDRIIVRLRPGGFRIYGTWSHGDLDQVSAASAPLKALFFLEKAQANYLEPLSDVRDILKRLLPRIVKPLVSASWWNEVLSLADRIAREVPCYRLYFDRSGKVVELLKGLG